MKTVSMSLALLLVICTPYQVDATLIDLRLDFSAEEQSIWGANGSSANFGDSGSTAIGPVSFGYDIGADSGTVSAQFSGDLVVDYASFLAAPGGTALNLSFLGDDPDGGNLWSALGAWVTVDASVAGLNEDLFWAGYELEIDKSFVPTIDGMESGSDSVTVGSGSVNVLAAQVKANFDIEQTNNFEVSGIDGLLAYELRGSGETTFLPFNLDTAASLDLDLYLGDYGTWDFWFMDMTLDNLFSATFDAELNLYERHLGCGLFGLSYCSWNAVSLADIDVYDSSPFSLGFNDIPSTNRFSIAVGSTSVPEPSTLALLGIGLFGMGLSKFRRV